MQQTKAKHCFLLASTFVFYGSALSQAQGAMADDARKALATISGRLEIKGLEQPVQRAIGYGWDVGVLYIFAADARENFTVNLKLPVGTVVRGGAYSANLADHHEQQHCKRSD